MIVGADRGRPPRRTAALGTLRGQLVSVAEQSWDALGQARYKARNWAPGSKVLGFIVLALLASTLAYHVLTYIVPLPVWPGTERFCGNRHGLGCEFTTHLLADAIVAAVAYAWFLSRQSRNSTTWRRRAKTKPHELFTWLSPGEGGLTDLAAEAAAEAHRPQLRLPWPRRPSPLIRSILGRDDLVRGIADDLEAGCDPQVIVGESAAGKTMVLVKLADYLARRRKVPIPISVQDAPKDKLDFETLAREAYRDASPRIKTEDLEKQWEELRHRSQAVVLVDDLEKVAGDVTPDDVEAAINRAARRKLRLVIASRPYGLPVTFTRGKIDLEPLRKEDVHKDLVRQVRRAFGISRKEARSLVGDLVGDTEMGLTLYYLSLARVLANHRRLTARPEGAEPRLWLVDEYRRALAEGVVRDDAGLLPAQRASVLADLEPIAFVRVLGARTGEEIAAKLEDWGLQDLDVGRAIERASRLGVVRVGHKGIVRFNHPTTMAFFASCFLRDRGALDGAWNELIDTTWGPYRALTLVFATLGMRDARRTAEVVTRLLERAQQDARASRGGVRPGSTWLRAAAEIGRRGQAVDEATALKIVRHIEHELDGTSEFGREHLPLLVALGGLCQKTHRPDAYRALWKYAMTETDYWFSRQATRELLEAPAALDVLFPDIDAVMNRARDHAVTLEKPALDDRNSDVILGLRTLAWILPSLRSITASKAEKLAKRGAGEEAIANLNQQWRTLEQYQEELVEYARTLTVQRGLEAAIAQGIKFDAFRDDKRPLDRFAVRMLDAGDGRARFWFSRLLLVQAVAKRSKDDRGAARALVRSAKRDKNVFVRHTARLCLRGIDAKKDHLFLFEDLTDVVSGTPYRLARETSQLIGDVVLALNLNEYGGPRSRWAFGRFHDAPACLTRSKRRHEVLRTNTKSLSCRFVGYQDEAGRCLCPYSFDPPPGAKRREITRAFCRYQRLNARRVPWHPGMRTKHQREFWARMEELARY